MFDKQKEPGPVAWIGVGLVVCPCGTIRKASKPEGGEEAMKKAALTILGLAISALVYTKVGLMIMVGLLEVLFVALALNRPKDDKPRGL